LGGTPKRLFDIVLGTLLLTSTLPLLVVTAVTLKLAGARPLFSREIRLGLKGRSFEMIAYTTTTQDSPHVESTDRYGSRGRRTPHIAHIGMFLKESGISRLPQLVNVIRGDMSLVGPRALSSFESSCYGDGIAIYLSARPGLVQPRRRTAPEDKSAAQACDEGLDYVRRWCFSADVATLLRVIFALRDH
jgi:exopolysaccharide production protein ExoY